MEGCFIKMTIKHCPHCRSTRITTFIDIGEKGFKCQKCGYVWKQMRLIKQEILNGN